MMSALENKTTDFLAALNSGDFAAIGQFYTEDIVADLPMTPKLIAKSEVMATWKEEYETHLYKGYVITSHKIIGDENTTMTEFSMTISGTILKGVCVLEWRDTKIARIRAYIPGIDPRTGEVLILEPTTMTEY